jgi:signal peptide peptidase SppA
MKYSRILKYVASSLWAITDDKMAEIVEMLAFKAQGGDFTPEEIQARVGGGAERPVSSRSGAVAIIPIRGTIAHRMGGMEDYSGGVSTEGIAQMFRAAMSDTQIGSIVLDVDSPGGTVTGLQELAAEMRAAKGQKPVVAVANGLMASAAYWIASQADEIVSIPSGEVGSIGVVMPHKDLSAALEKEGIKFTVFRAGKHKWAGNPFEPLTEAQAGEIQARVDGAYKQFVADVSAGRNVPVATVREGYGEGRVLTAKDAKASGLIDRIATMDETIARLAGRRSVAVSGPRAEEPPADVLPEVVTVAEATFVATADEADRLRRMELF